MHKQTLQNLISTNINQNEKTINTVILDRIPRTVIRRRNHYQTLTVQGKKLHFVAEYDCTLMSLVYLHAHIPLIILHDDFFIFDE